MAGLLDGLRLQLGDEGLPDLVGGSVAERSEGIACGRDVPDRSVVQFNAAVHHMGLVWIERVKPRRPSGIYPHIHQMPVSHTGGGCAPTVGVCATI